MVTAGTRQILILSKSTGTVAITLLKYAPGLHSSKNAVDVKWAV